MLETCRSLAAIGYKWEEQNVEDDCKNVGRIQRHVISDSEYLPEEQEGYGSKPYDSSSLPSIQGYTGAHTVNGPCECERPLSSQGHPLKRQQCATA
ncbi:rCG38827, isoform CRA_a [Rattus norvegicus]|nr:rCG38827, isoform CRA_a [Rattus norvegicus]